jgi:hypothetical protein
LSLILSKENRLRVSQNKVLRRITGNKREEVVGGWRRLHNLKLHDLHTSNQGVQDGTLGLVACMGEMRNV